MDPLSALAIAAAVFQFGELGSKFLKKGWAKYKELQEEKEHNSPGQLQKRRKELEELVEELKFVSRIQDPPATTSSTTPTTPAQEQLLQALSTCPGISHDLGQVIGRLIKQLEDDAKGTNVDNSWHHRLFRNSKRQQPEAQGPVTDAEIARLMERLESARRKALDSVILCIWDNSKQTKEWELYFSRQLDVVTELLKRVETFTTQSPGSTSSKLVPTQLRDPVEFPMDDIQDIRTGVETSRLVPMALDVADLQEALLPLVRTGRSIPLTTLSNEIIATLSNTTDTMDDVRSELVKAIWSKDWEPEACTTGASSTVGASILPNIDSSLVANAARAGIWFDVIDARQQAIVKTFDKTFSWVLESDPFKEDETPSWESFPRWLENDSTSIYWITGKPGSGKSTMMKFLAEQRLVWDALSKQLGSLHLVVLRYYAWHSGGDLQKSLQGLKRTLICQVPEDCPDLARILVPRRWALCQILRSTSFLPSWELFEVDEAWGALLSECGKTLKLALFIDGLDEFDVPPMDIIAAIREISNRCQVGAKICVASRPWNEFNDEYNDGPMLEIHLLTKRDMTTFVQQKFKDSKALKEQEKIFPDATIQLCHEIVRRANGVFLWISLVVPHLLGLLQDGHSISEARKILEDIPTDLRDLYQTIWDGIRSENKSNASFSLQIVRAAGEPLPWLTMWLIESKSTQDQLISLSEEPDLQIQAAKQILKRRLAGSTRGILEVGGEVGYFVDFIHRTARDWAANPDTWISICGAFEGRFDPHLCIMDAETLILSLQKDTTNLGYFRDPEDSIIYVLWHASQVADVEENTEKLIRIMELLKIRSELQNMWLVSLPKRIITKKVRGVSKFEDTALLELAARFAILPYIKVKLPSPSTICWNLLPEAIFGFFMVVGVPPFLTQRVVPIEQRLAMVKYLLDDLDSLKIGSKKGVRALKDDIMELGVKDPEYFGVLGEYLEDKNGASMPTRLANRFRSVLRQQ